MNRRSSMKPKAEATTVPLAVIEVKYVLADVDAGRRYD
jgi:hypothetical protein